jgi:hypothetical protein
VIVITGKPPDDSVRDLASLVLVKPLEFDEMMQAISTVMNARTRDPAARASGRVMAQPT